MRQFQECQTTEREMTKVICNCCGKEIDVKNGIPREDFLTVEKQWDIFPERMEKRTGLSFAKSAMTG